MRAIARLKSKIIKYMRSKKINICNIIINKLQLFFFILDNNGLRTYEIYINIVNAILIMYKVNLKLLKTINKKQK